MMLQLVLFVSVLKGGWGGGWVEAGGWMPLPTRPQRTSRKLQKLAFGCVCVERGVEGELE